MADTQSPSKSEPGVALPAFDLKNPASFAEDLDAFRARIAETTERLRSQDIENRGRLEAVEAQAQTLARDLAEFRTALDAKVAEEMEAFRKELRRNEAAANRVRDSLDQLDAEVRKSLHSIRLRRTFFPLVLLFLCILEAVFFGIHAYFSGALPWLKP